MASDRNAVPVSEESASLRENSETAEVRAGVGISPPDRTVSRDDLKALAEKSGENRVHSEERALGTTRGQRTFLRVLVAVTLCLLGWQWFRAVNDRPEGVTIERGVYFRIDINTDDWRELDVLDGIGETLARRIVEYRRTNGPYEEPGDLEKVPGVGPITVERLKPWIKVTRTNESASRTQSPPQ